MRSIRAPLLALVALAVLAPLAQADPLTKISLLGFSSPWLCVEAGASTSVTFTLVDRRTGHTAGTATVGATGTNCAGGGGTSFRTSFGRGYFAGGRVVATPAGSPAVTFDVPYGSADTADNGTTSVVRVGGLPATSTVQLNALPPVAVAGSRYVSGPIAGYGANVTVNATVAGVPLTALFSTSQSNFSASGSSVDVFGTDPLGAPVNVSVVSAGRSASFALAPSGTRSVRANLPFELASGAVVGVSQAGWFSHTGRAGSAAIRNDGFSVSTPVGTTAFYDVNATLLDDGVDRPPTTPLGCRALGSSSFVTGSCGVPYPDRYGVSITGLVMAAGDSASVDETSRTRDRLTISAQHLGFTGSLQGFLEGFVEQTVNAPVRIVAHRPAGGGYRAAIIRGRARAFDGSIFVQGEGDAPLKLHLTRGTTVTVSGPSLRRARRYVFDLAASIAGTTLGGRTSPGARVRVDEGGSNDGKALFTTAGTDGRFAVALDDPQPGDQIGVTAVNVATRDVTSLDVTFGAPVVRITGVHDQQLVRGRIRVGVRAAGARHVLLDGGELVNASRSSAPFTFSVNTRPAGDGPAEITATAYAAAGSQGFDYLWVIVDNTAPRGALPSEAFARSGRRLRLHPGASDDNGIASVLVTWGDGTRQRLRGRRALAALSHVYRRSGDFRVRVTITDRAGNRRLVRTVVHVG
jgi:hypothetical protein